MGKRQRESREEWEEELKYIQGVSPETNKSFNCDPECFGRYVEMQAKFAAEDGCQDLADAMRTRLQKPDYSQSELNAGDDLCVGPSM